MQKKTCRQWFFYYSIRSIDLLIQLYRSAEYPMEFLEFDSWKMLPAMLL